MQKKCRRRGENLLHRSLVIVFEKIALTCIRSGLMLNNYYNKYKVQYNFELYIFYFFLIVDIFTIISYNMQSYINIYITLSRYDFKPKLMSSMWMKSKVKSMVTSFRKDHTNRKSLHHTSSLTVMRILKVCRLAE